MSACAEVSSLPAADRIELASDLLDVERLIRFVRSFGSRHALTDNVVFDLTLALEEVFTNVVRHGCEDGRRHFIRITLCMAEDEVDAEVEDDALPFNPLLVPEMDISAPLDARRGGGMGIHLVRRLMDRVDYEGTGGLNRLFLRKILGSAVKGR